MDIRHLKAFIAVFEERNITTAAQRLFVSQPTLSVTIKQLEEALGVSLFKRVARGVEVSEEARALYPQASALVGEAEALKHRFRRGEQHLSLTLGVEADISPQHVSAFLQLAMNTVPDLHLSLQDGCTGDARLAVEEQRCEDELFLPIWDDPFVCAIAAGTEPGPNPSLFPWIICPDHPSHQRLMPLYGHAITQAAQSSSLHLSLTMVAAGIGVAALPLSLVETAAGVATHPLSNPLPSRRAGLCFSSKALEHPALRLLHSALRDQACVPGM
jgi:DNA-binding transcriptional LysR family regulator